MIRRFLLAAALAAAVLPRPADAQVVRPWLDWRTLRTEHFDVHFPAELEPWTRDVASRLEGVYASVGALVGSVPRHRVTVVVDDPAGEANGSAYSLLRTPYILLYPTPPDPRSPLGHTRGPSEQLAVHEFAHIAHLTRPTRDPFARWLAAIDPRGLGPMARTAPRWVREGYATYAEGRLTGYGRPYGVVRAAILRQWALEGRLPTYAQLDATTGPYQVPGMAYLAGSAFLEWLAARRGEESLTQLWRRMSAREARSFDQAFVGVYGGTPSELYGLFTVELTANALQARRLLSEAGLVTGDTVQHLAWGTGDVALSPDGRLMALTLGGPARSWSRVVIWRTDAPPSDSAAADSALLARDPDDVPPFRVWPAARPAVASLRPADGVLAYRSPRFVPGGDEVLVVRSAPIGGGATRDDLFAWSWRTGAVRRVTRGASIRSADPLPDGRRAAAVQCRDGFCGLVLVDLQSGEVAPLADGSVDRVFDRPRVSPDGTTVAAAMQEGGSWKIVTVPVAGGPVRVVSGDGGHSVYDPAWTPDGQAIVATDESAGIANLVRITPPSARTERLTSVVGAAAAPEVDPATGAVYYLSLHAGGWDVYRLHPDSTPRPSIPVLGDSLAPAVQRVFGGTADTLARQALPPSRPYGLGPRWTRILPFGATDLDGGTGGVFIHNADPVGRLALGARGVWGDPGMERGASAGAVWRGTRPALAADAWYLEHAPSRRPAFDDPGLDARYVGGALSTGNAWSAGRNAQEWRLGASAGLLERTEGDADTRTLAFGRYAVSDGRRIGNGYATGSVSLFATAGRTEGEDWARGMATAAFGAGIGGLGARAEATLGRVSRGAPRWERFVLGGSRAQLVDEAVLSQRVAMPALRWGALEGEDLLTYRVSTSLGALTPYFWGGTTDATWDRWLRVAGVELSTGFPGLRAAATPAGRLLAGVAYGLDGAYENDLTAYFSVSFAP
jgi:hypothetical protein